MFQKRDKFLGVFVILLGIWVFFESNTWVQLVESDPAGPAGAPRLLAAGIIFLGTVLIAGSFFASPEKSTGPHMDKTIVSILLLCLAYASLLQVVGYPIMTPILIGGVMRLLMTKDLKEILTVSLTSTFVLYGVFHFFLKVKFPLGVINLLLD